MSIALSTPPRRFSREEYRSWCDQQPRGRFERIDGYIFAMAPERGAHLRMKQSVYEALARAIKAAGVDCQALPDGATVESGESDYEPDATVNCGTPMADDEVAAPNPVVVVEVLSPNSISTDTGAKLAGYFRVASIAHYLIVDPRKPVVIHHRRAGTIIETAIVSRGPISMNPPGITISVEDIYAASEPG